MGCRSACVLVMGALLVQGGCSRGDASATDASPPGDAAAPETPPSDLAAEAAPDLAADSAPDRGAPDADRQTICVSACAYLTEPCADYSPPRSPACREECARRSELQLACAWTVLSFPPADVSRMCDELSRCLDLRGP